jgi:GGDEF domain-containing protein
MKRGSILLAIALTITIPAIIAWPALRIARNWTSGQEAVRSSYGVLRRLAIKSIDLPATIAETTWTEAALKTWEQDNRLLAIVISDQAGDVLYALPELSPYYQESGLQGKRPVYVHPEFSVTKFSGVISSGLVLDALYVTLRQGEIYQALKDATISLIVLIALISAWLIAASTATPANGSSEAVTEPPSAGPIPTADKWTETAADSKSEPEASRATAAEVSFNQENPSVQNMRMPPENLKNFPELMELSSPPLSIRFPAINLPMEDDSQPVQDASQPEEDDSQPEEIELLSAEEPSPEVSQNQIPRTSSIESPRGLYDTQTGLGWEAYLRERLGSELRRSASFEQDLSILIASLDSASGRSDPNYAVFAKTSRNFFSFNDLAFIFGTNGLAIILPNTDIDQAMQLSEELLKKLALLLQDRSDPKNYFDLFMGLSSRAGRLVEADRILGEAMAAHRRARQERDTHIIAFRPDPEKFRAYLANS